MSELHTKHTRELKSIRIKDVRLFAFMAGGEGRRGKQFSTSLGKHVLVSKAETSMFYLQCNGMYNHANLRENASISNVIAN